MKFHLFITIFFITLGACAKKRPVEKVYDLDGNRWAKAAFDSAEPWLSKVTIVKNGQNTAFGFVGLQSQVQLGFFKFTQNQLQFVSAIDLYGESANTDQVINAWDITHTDYHRPVVGGKVTNQEAENDRISWDLKRFFKVDWHTAKISEKASFPFSIDTRCWEPKNTSLVDGSQEISAEHISFTLAVDYQIVERCIEASNYFNGDYTHTIHYKYSFMPDIKSDYKPYVYNGENDPLMKKYGYFNTVLAKLDDFDRVQNHFLMNRWQLGKTHSFYFAEDFPEEYKWIYNDPEKGIFARTNKLFKDHNINLQFEIKDNDGTKKFGDIRYSFIKFVKELDETSPLGYGPSDAHPLTGEIFAANSIMWTARLKSYVKIYQEEMARMPTKFESSSIYRQMELAINESPDTWTQSASFLQDRTLSNFYRFLLPEFTYGLRGSDFARPENESAPQMTGLDTIKEFIELKPAYHELNQKLAHSETVIRQQLDSFRHVSDFTKSNATIYHLSDEILHGANLRLQNAASPEQVINDILYRVAIHEFGHNLNLRHNFYGSVDAQIDRKVGEDLSLKRTSSVMDYIAGKDDVGLAYDWEAYDRAALIYAYSNGEIDPAIETGRTFLYCTDEHRNLNALCNAFDQGSTPSEVMMSLIDNYDQGYWTRNFRWDRAYWNTSRYESTVFSTMFDVKKIVKMYQETFLPNQVRQELTGVPNASIQLSNSISAFVRSDMRQAIKLAASFYQSVIKQGFLDRPYNDSFDDFQGTLTQIGIFKDKLYAALFLLGDDAFPLNPNFGAIPVSFISLRDEPGIGSLLDNILFDTFVNSGDAYNGFDDWGRLIYARNAANYFDFEGEQGAIDLMKVVCYEKNSFELRFNTDTDNYDGTGQPLLLAVLTPTFNENADGNFSEETQVAVVKINGKYYVAGMEKNRYSSALITKADLNGVLTTHYYYSAITGGDTRSCY